MKIIQDEAALQLSFTSTVPNIEQAMEEIREFLNGHHNTSYHTKQNVFVISEELLQNAHNHGNKHNEEKSIFYSLSLDENSEVTITVEDEGEGYDVSEIRESLPSDPKHINKTGLILVHALSKEISFDKGGRKIAVKVSLEDSIQKLIQRSGIKHV